jgi:hypothetical protein
MGIIRTFKCKFNDRVTTDNRDGVIQSLINQFEGLGAEPEVTLDGDTFSLTLNLSDNLTPTMVRDKLSWNYFIDRVTTGDSIRKIKVMRMPKSVKEVIGDGQGQLDGIASDTGVNEILLEDGRPQAQSEYKIDMGDRPDGPPVRRRTPAVFGLGMSRGGSKFAHHADLSHPVPGSAEELLDHMENHHPDEVARLVAKANSIDPGQTWSKMKENFFRKFKNQGRPQDVFDDLSDDHLSRVHPDGKEAGDHPHKHGNDLNIDIPDTVPQETSTPKELIVTSSWVKQADPGSLRNEGQAFTNEPDNVMGPEDLDSMATDVTKLPKIFATENSAGGSQFGQPFDRKTVMDSVNREPQESRGPRVTVFNSGSSPTRETGGPIPFNSWYSEVGSESIMPAAKDKKAPLDFTASLKGEKASSENIDSAIELPEATQGGTVLGLEGWFSASLHFGYDDGDSDDDGTYDYSEDNDKDED